MSNSERWDHSGYNELQNEDKSYGPGSKRQMTSKKNFFKKDSKEQSDRSNISDQNEAPRKTKKFSTYREGARNSGGDWQVEKDHTQLDEDDTYKKDLKKKRKDDYYNDQYSDKYMQKNYNYGEDVRYDQSQTSFNEGKGRYFRKDYPQQRPYQQPVFYGREYQNMNRMPNYMYNSQNFQGGVNKVLPNMYRGGNMNAVTEDEMLSHVEDSASKDNKKSAKSFRREETTETEETAMNSMMNTPGRQSTNSAINNNPQQNSTPSVGYSPKNDQIYMCNLLKMPNNINFNSPMRVGENILFNNRNMNMYNPNMFPGMPSPLRNDTPLQRDNMANIPYNNYSMNMTSLPLNMQHSMNYSNNYANNYSNMNSPQCDEHNDYRKFQPMVGHSFNNVRPNMMNMNNKRMFENPQSMSGGFYRDKKPQNNGFNIIGGPKQYRKYNNTNTTNNLSNTTSNGMYRMKYVKSDKYLKVNDLKGNLPSSDYYKRINQTQSVNMTMNPNTNGYNYNYGDRGTYKKEASLNRYDKANLIKEERTEEDLNKLHKDYISSGNDDSQGYPKEDVLKVSVKLIDREVTLSVCKGEDVYNTARGFVQKNKLNPQLIKPIGDRIKSAMNSIEKLLDLPINESERESLSLFQTHCSKIKEENDIDLSCITDMGSTNYLSEDFSLTADDAKMIERLNLSS